MISGYHRLSVFARHTLAFATIVAACVTAMPAYGQGFGFFGNRNGVVGGVSVDAQGMLQSASAVETSGQLKALRKDVGAPSDAMRAGTTLRMVSLGKLQAEIAAAQSEGRRLSEDVLYLAGLQRIEYVFVYPKQNDIVIAGPAEGWVVRDDATVVGETTGRPVIQLEDLLVAFRNTEATRQAPMSVSIDPTPEGEVRLRRLLSTMGGRGFNPAQAEPAMKKALGAQLVSFNSVPTDSRMASTLVAADYQMKRLAMGIDASPVKGMPSYLSMIKNSGASKTQPRWWMACDYDAILHSEDMLAWKLTGLGIKAMTEEQFVDASGVRSQSGRSSKAAQAWADNFTSKFEELCKTNSAFGDLRNVMDLNIIATVITAHDLESVAGCNLSLIRGEAVETPAYATPKTIAPHCSFVRGAAGWTVSASGGIEINPWKLVSTESKMDKSIGSVRSSARQASAKWWWN
ncbi:MAG: DUF1598 domain-containing protein [Aureliella sp.]